MPQKQHFFLGSYTSFGVKITTKSHKSSYKDQFESELMLMVTRVKTYLLTYLVTYACLLFTLMTCPRLLSSSSLKVLIISR